MTKPKTVATTVAWLLGLPNHTYVPEIGLANILETGWA